MANIPPPPPEEALYGGKDSVPPPPPEHELYAPKEQAPKWYEIEKQEGLPRGPKEFIKSTLNTFKDSIANPMPGSMLAAPLRLVQKAGQQTGAEVARGTEHGLGTGLARAAGFLTQAAMDPLSYEGGMLKGEGPAKSVSQDLMKPGVEEMLNNLREQSATAKTAIEEHTSKIMDSIGNVVKKYGDDLNAAKKELKIPVTVAEREKAILETGNPHGLNTENTNDMWNKIIQPTKDRSEMVKNVAKFKDLAAHITDESKRVRIASVLQDNINNIVDWTKSGDTTEGVLKTQYKQLREMAMPESLKASKAKMGEVLDLTSELEKKMSEPGQAEAYLRNIVLGKSAKTKDGLMAMKHLEELSGEKIFDKIKAAIETDKASEVAIKKLEKIKPVEKKAMEESGISMQDILSHKITGWTSVIKDLLKFKDSIYAGAKKAVPAVGRQGLIRASSGFALGQTSDKNKAELDKALERLKNAK